MYRIPPARHHEDDIGSVIVGVNISIIVVQGVHIDVIEIIVIVVNVVVDIDHQGNLNNVFFYKTKTSQSQVSPLQQRN